MSTRTPAKPMTKTEKRKRVRVIRSRLARFIGLQNAGMQAYVRKNGSSALISDPDYVAMNHLLVAQKELNALVTQLREEGYGQ